MTVFEFGNWVCLYLSALRMESLKLFKVYIIGDNWMFRTDPLFVRNGNFFHYLGIYMFVSYIAYRWASRPHLFKPSLSGDVGSFLGRSGISL